MTHKNHETNISKGKNWTTIDIQPPCISRRNHICIYLHIILYYIYIELYYIILNYVYYIISDGRIMGAHCRNAHVLHCLLKIIMSADLLPFLELGSIPNSHTNNPNSERGKNWSKTNGKNQKITPCHLSSFPSDPLHGSKLFPNA